MAKKSAHKPSGGRTPARPVTIEEFRIAARHLEKAAEKMREVAEKMQTASIDQMTMRASTILQDYIPEVLDFSVLATAEVAETEYAREMGIPTKREKNQARYQKYGKKKPAK